MNPKADTVEDLQGRRKLLHMSMATLAEGDLHRQVAKIDEVVQVRSGVWRRDGLLSRMRQVRGLIDAGSCGCREPCTRGFWVQVR